MKLGSYKKPELGIIKLGESTQLKEKCRKLLLESNENNENASTNYDDGDESNNGDNSSIIRSVGNERSQLFKSYNSVHSLRGKSNARDVNFRLCIGSVSGGFGLNKKPKSRNGNFVCLT